MYAKKSLGQHFLKSEKALRSIVEAGGIKAGELVLEIGPGQGALTERLLEAGAKVLAVEKDDNLFEELKTKFVGKNIDLVHEDILEFEPPKDEYKLIANIPYNITGAIFKKFLGGKYQPSRAVLLVQKEVAERIVARDNKESILSISIKVYGEPRYVETVLAGSFAPAPKVDSAIILVENISKNFFTSEKGSFSEEKFFELLKSGFSSKRKKLSSNIATKFPKELVLKAFSDLKLDPNLRAEDVELDTWRELSSILCV